MLNENIRNMRMALGISQDELAESLHVVRQTVSKWEKGLSVPNAGLLRELARQLNTTVSTLLGKAESPGAIPVEASLDQLMGAVEPLPPAVTAMINQQGTIHQLVIEAYTEKSKNKLLQVMLLDPTVSNYNNAVALIDEMFQREKEILPELHW